ncbi:MAG: response regulator transcription factor [Christensenellaceae bacterium]|jgi:two-component system response regulator ResD
MYRILVVDDEAGIRALVRKYATFEGHEVTEAKDGLEAVSLAMENEYDIIIMDVMMPELDGFSAVGEIRKFSKTPVIMLSARGEEYDRIHGFEVGVDDYVVKPFSPKELMLRIAAVMNRYAAKEKEESTAHDIYVYEGLQVDFTSRKVFIDEEEVLFAPKEYDLLFYMIRHEGVALSRERLLEEVWGYDFYGDDRTLDTHIKMLRKALGKYRKCITTLRGIGYRFDGI